VTEQDDKQWPPPETADDRAIVHIEEGAKGGTVLLGSGGALVESQSDDE
jgi:hypothetical protein